MGIYLVVYQQVTLYSHFDKNSRGETRSPSLPCFLPKKNPKDWAQNNKNRIISAFFGLILHIEKVPYFTSKTLFFPITNHKTGRSGSILIDLNVKFNS